MFWGWMSQCSKTGAFGKSWWSNIYLGLSCVIVQHGSIRELWEKSVIFREGLARVESSSWRHFLPLAVFGCCLHYLISIYFSEITVLCYITPLSTKWDVKVFQKLKSIKVHSAWPCKRKWTDSSSTYKVPTYTSVSSGVGSSTARAFSF